MARELLSQRLEHPPECKSLFRMKVEVFQDDLIHTIERFKQTRVSDLKKSRGAGLGLTICKALVELHGGEISVKSVPDQGSVFKFNLGTTV